MRLDNLMYGGREFVDEAWLDDVMVKHPELAAEIKTAISNKPSIHGRYLAWIHEEAKPKDLTYKEIGDNSLAFTNEDRLDKMK